MLPKFTVRLSLRFRLACLGLALLPTLAGCGTQTRKEADVQNYLFEAQRSVQVDATDAKARQWADRAIAAAPQDPVTYFGDPGGTLPRAGIADVFVSVGDDPALVDYMAQAVQKFPGDDRGYQLQITALNRLGRAADRKAVARKLIAILAPALQKPGATDLLERSQALAQAYFDAGDAQTGASQFQKIIQAYPAAPEPPNSLAYNWAVADTNLPQALALSEQALALARKKGYTDEQTAHILDTLGWVQYRQGDFKDAAQNLEQAAALIPRQAETRYHLGAVYAAEGQPEAARTELNHAVLLSQNYAEAEAALKALPPASSGS